MTKDSKELKFFERFIHLTRRRKQLKR